MINSLPLIETGTYKPWQAFLGREVKEPDHSKPSTIYSEDSLIKEYLKNVRVLRREFSDDQCHCEKCR